MSESKFSWDRYHQAPIIGIIRNVPFEVCLKIAQAYYNAGLYSLEITMNTHKAPKIISTLRKEFPELNIGAGTVCSLDDLNLALDAGAQFIVTPIVNIKVIERCVALSIPVFPGAYSPSEIYNAWSLGASAVKIFPATQLGPQYVKDVLAPLNKIKLLPTGGVSIDTIKSFFEAGAFGVGMGSSLLNKEAIQQGNYKILEQHFKNVKNTIKGFIDKA